MKCSTGKKQHNSQALAEQALIQNRVQFDASKAIGVYQCEVCDSWHLTSKGQLNPVLKKAMEDGSLQREIDRYQWQQQYR
ncbi:MAG: hypothetical protein JJ975_02160 [Bacteroidia bacterium]|nr:hypothetical protein [Bacteroidia bacterium]